MPLRTTSHAEVDPLAAGLQGYYNIHRLSGAENHWATHFTGKEITGSHLFRHNRRPLFFVPCKNSMALNLTLSEHAGEDFCSLSNTLIVVVLRIESEKFANVAIHRNTANLIPMRVNSAV